MALKKFEHRKAEKEREWERKRQQALKELREGVPMSEMQGEIPLQGAIEDINKRLVHLERRLGVKA